eukprot:6209265-Pleurochrysis_carterae.AAC.6
MKGSLTGPAGLLPATRERAENHGSVKLKHTRGAGQSMRVSEEDAAIINVHRRDCVLRQRTRGLCMETTR